jgi:hypothetical protein
MAEMVRTATKTENRATQMIRGREEGIGRGLRQLAENTREMMVERESTERECGAEIEAEAGWREVGGARGLCYRQKSASAWFQGVISHTATCGPRSATLSK